MQISQETLMEFARLGIIYVHLIACCVAIGLVLTSDISMVRQLLRGDPSERMETMYLSELQRSVAVALSILWLSGISVVLLDMSVKGWEYLSNPKLHAKIVIVSLLTLNGVVLHCRVLPVLKRAGSLLKLSFSQYLLAFLTGSLSGVSWFYAAMLGIGRPLSWKYSFVQLTFLYPLLVIAGFFAMLLLTFWAKYRSTGEHASYQETTMLPAVS
jgi:hypothetical protein